MSTWVRNMTDFPAIAGCFATASSISPSSSAISAAPSSARPIPAAFAVIMSRQEVPQATSGNGIVGAIAVRVS